MRLSEAVWRERSNIIAIFHYGIVTSLRTTWAICHRTKPPQEPDLVAGLVLDGCQRIHDGLAPLLRMYGMQTSIVGVFCHQTPKVHYSGMAGVSCELGDLLFVHVHRSAGGRVRRNALLYQAKSTSHQPHKLGQGERDQLRLYADWPDFEYVNSGSLTGNRRAVTPKMLHSGAQYLLLDNRPPTNPSSGLAGTLWTYPAGSCMPDVILRDHNPLELELVDFLLVRSGRPFEDYATAMSVGGWSLVIWDLIHAGLRKFARARSWGAGHQRIAGGTGALDGYSFATATSESALATVTEVLGPEPTHKLFMRDFDRPPRDPKFQESLEDPEAGVSMILIETSETDESAEG